MSPMEWEKEDLKVLCLFLGPLDDLGALETDDAAGQTLLGHETECTNVGVEEGDVEEEQLCLRKSRGSAVAHCQALPAWMAT